MHITETCDADAACLITPVTTFPAMPQGMSSTAEIHERLAAKGLLPADHFKEGKNVVPWTGRSCRKFRNNVFRLQLHALA